SITVHPPARSPWVVTYRLLLLALSMTSALMTPSATLLAGAQHSDGATNSQLCTVGAAGCAPDDGVPIAAPSHGIDGGTPLPPPPPCEELCTRIKAAYHDPRTQTLLLPLAQTPTGRGVLDYLLSMTSWLGSDFITWRDLGKMGNAGE